MEANLGQWELTERLEGLLRNLAQEIFSFLYLDIFT